MWFIPLKVFLSTLLIIAWNYDGVLSALDCNNHISEEIKLAVFFAVEKNLTDEGANLGLEVRTVRV